MLHPQWLVDVGARGPRAVEGVRWSSGALRLVTAILLVVANVLNHPSHGDVERAAWPLQADVGRAASSAAAACEPGEDPVALESWPPASRAGSCYLNSVAMHESPRTRPAL